MRTSKQEAVNDGHEDTVTVIMFAWSVVYSGQRGIQPTLISAPKQGRT